MPKFSILQGKTLYAVDISTKKGNDSVIFTLSDGTRYMLCHYQDCCETVYLEDVIGAWEDILYREILLAEEVIENSQDEYGEPEKWTFYKLATARGYITLRWYGTSNGYYSISVYFDDLDPVTVGPVPSLPEEVKQADPPRPPAPRRGKALDIAPLEGGFYIRRKGKPLDKI